MATKVADARMDLMLIHEAFHEDVAGAIDKTPSRTMPCDDETNHGGKPTMLNQDRCIHEVSTIGDPITWTIVPDARGRTSIHPRRSEIRTADVVNLSPCATASNLEEAMLVVDALQGRIDAIHDAASRLAVAGFSRTYPDAEADSPLAGRWQYPLGGGLFAIVVRNRPDGRSRERNAIVDSLPRPSIEATFEEWGSSFAHEVCSIDGTAMGEWNVPIKDLLDRGVAAAIAICEMRIERSREPRRSSTIRATT